MSLRFRPRPAPPPPEPPDLVVRGGTLVTPDGLTRADFSVRGGKIVRIAPDLAPEAVEVLDATGTYVFPGVIDAHVHFNEPGHADWEGLSCGSAALAAGGGTCFFDLPLHGEPPVLDAAGLREKRRLAEQSACTDFALWGGFGPGNLDQFAGLRDAGAIGLLAFLGSGGNAGFPPVDHRVLREGMKRAAKLGLPVAIRAEDESHVVSTAKTRPDAASFLASRPVSAELEGIRIALELAGETGCALHVVRVGSPEAAALIADARDARVDVSAETCPHYLLLNDTDVQAIGIAAKCVPPIRNEASRQRLWREVRAGHMQTIGSAHAPYPPELKTGNDFFSAPDGLAGLQHGFELLVDACRETWPADLPRLAALCARNVARRFRLEDRKGSLAEGLDADFCLVRTAPARAIAADELWTRHRLSPYAGRRSRVRISHTYLRGRPIWADGRLTNQFQTGQFLKPTR